MKMKHNSNDRCEHLTTKEFLFKNSPSVATFIANVRRKSRVNTTIQYKCFVKIKTLSSVINVIRHHEKQ